MNRITLVFPGQGTQYVGMGKKVYDRVPEARHLYAEASDILHKDMKKLCFEGNEEEIQNTENGQIVIYTVCISMLRAYEHEIGIKPVYSAGHSLGEYAALTAAGAVTFRDGLNMVRVRGKLMQEVLDKTDACMSAVIGVERSIIEAVCTDCSGGDQLAAIANYNSSKQIVISGSREAVHKAGAKLEQLGAKVIAMKIRAPFHTSLMQEAADRFKEELKKYTYSKFDFPVISNQNAKPYDEDCDMPEVLSKHIVSPILWEQTINYCLDQNVDTFIELGPKQVLKNLSKNDGVTAGFYFYDSDLEVLLAERRNVPTEGDAWYRFIEACIAAAICTRNGNWDETEYREGVIEPYQKVKDMFYRIKDKERYAVKAQALQAFDMLNTVLKTKKVADQDRIDIIDKILQKSFYYECFASLIH